jgi:flavin reductase (DIM6/NTAB) family NADH-FMN oxidoreductase RutF
VDGTPKGFTANAFSSVSADPPMVLICVNRQARSHPLISRAGHFCVNLLRLDQQSIAQSFASHEPVNPFDSLAYGAAKTGSPVLEGTLAFLDCELAEEHTAGTHTVFIGTVLACGVRDGAPLGYFNASYRDFGCLIP